MTRRVFSKSFRSSKRASPISKAFLICLFCGYSIAPKDSIWLLLLPLTIVPTASSQPARQDVPTQLDLPYSSFSVARALVYMFAASTCSTERRSSISSLTCRASQRRAYGAAGSPKPSMVAQNNLPALAKINHPALFADQLDSQPSADSLKSTLGTSSPAIESTAMAALGSSTTRKNPTDSSKNSYTS